MYSITLFDRTYHYIQLDNNDIEVLDEDGEIVYDDCLIELVRQEMETETYEDCE